MTEKLRYFINLKKNSKSSSAFYLGFFLLLWLLMFLLMIMSIIPWSYPINNFSQDIVINMILFIPIVLIGIYIIDHFLWEIRGKEIIIVKDNLNIQKKGKLFNTHHRIAFQKIKSISCSKENFILRYFREYFYMNGIILIKTNKCRFRLGQDISIELAQEIVDKLNQLMSESINVSDLSFRK